MPIIADDRALWIDVSVPIRPGVTTFDGDPAVHLEAGVVIVEGLDPCRVEPEEYDFVCVPLLIPGSDGGPTHAMLRRVSR